MRLIGRRPILGALNSSGKWNENRVFMSDCLYLTGISIVMVCQS